MSQDFVEIRVDVSGQGAVLFDPIQSFFIVGEFRSKF